MRTRQEDRLFALYSKLIRESGGAHEILLFHSAGVLHLSHAGVFSQSFVSSNMLEPRQRERERERETSSFSNFYANFILQRVLNLRINQEQS